MTRVLAARPVERLQPDERGNVDLTIDRVFTDIVNSTQGPPIGDPAKE